MRATIIVKDSKTDSIAQLVDVPSIDELTVDSVLTELRRRYPVDGYRIDVSQVKMARRACAA